MILSAVLILIIFGSSILLVVLVLLWFVFPALYGLPLAGTNPRRIHKALKLADLRPNEVLYDLGAGDGRVLLIARREFAARAVGIEVGPLQWVWARLRLALSGFGNQVRVRWGNFYKTNLSAADVIFVYATSNEVRKLAPYLSQQMKPGARVVSISADFPDWEPSAMDENELIFVYNMPPRKGSIESYLLKKAK